MNNIVEDEGVSVMSLFNSGFYNSMMIYRSIRIDLMMSGISERDMLKKLAHSKNELYNGS